MARLSAEGENLLETNRENLRKTAELMKKRSCKNQVKYNVGDVVKVLELLQNKAKKMRTATAFGIL